VTVAGFFAAPQLAARALALEQDVPPGSHAVGFAALNTTNGAGYGLAGLAVGGLLGFGPAVAFAVPLGACGLCLLGARLITRRRVDTSRDTGLP
jgi:hypothetical protein